MYRTKFHQNTLQDSDRIKIGITSAAEIVWLIFFFFLYSVAKLKRSSEEKKPLQLLHCEDQQAGSENKKVNL